jgi:hypothetical protein
MGWQVAAVRAGIGGRGRPNHPRALLHRRGMAAPWRSRSLRGREDRGAKVDPQARDPTGPLVDRRGGRGRNRAFACTPSLRRGSASVWGAARVESSR